MRLDKDQRQCHLEVAADAGALPKWMWPLRNAGWRPRTVTGFEMFSVCAIAVRWQLDECGDVGTERFVYVENARGAP